MIVRRRTNLGAFVPSSIISPGNPLTSQATSGQCLEVPKDYPFTYTIATGGSTVNNLSQMIDTDADFYCRGISFVAGSQALATADYSIQIQDSSLFKIQSDLTPWQLLAQATPLGLYVLEPQLFFPKGGRILLSLRDDTGVNNNQVQILFRGVAKYYV